MRSRVMPGSLVTMERRVPVKRLKSVDLPTLGRPRITRDGSSVVMKLGGGAVLHCTASRRGPKGARQTRGRVPTWLTLSRNKPEGVEQSRKERTVDLGRPRL